MAIKYFKIPQSETTVAVLSGCKFDVVNKIAKMMAETEFSFYFDKYLMPDTFRAVVRRHGDDVYDEKVGECEAKKKLMEKYYKHFDAKMAMFKRDLERLSERVTSSIKKVG